MNFYGNQDATQKISDLAIKKGADLVGIADLTLLKGVATHHPSEEFTEKIQVRHFSGCPS